MNTEKLLELIADDDLGLLKIKPKQSNTMTEDERLAESFFEINEFYRRFGREPEGDMTDVQEYRLATRLTSLKKDPEKIKELVAFDEFNLLVPEKAIESIDDILGDDDLNIFGNKGNDDIFTLKHVPQNIEPPDYVAQRKPCKNFDEFESLFQQCHADLSSGKRKLYQFANEQQIRQGHFFILRGVMCYVAEVGEKERKKGKVNARLKCIFENGTESDMLLRSLSCELYKDGRRISEHNEKLLDGFNQLNEKDTQTGFIYILKSLSANTDISSINDLYKIGFSTTSVKERIKNAESDPTFLYAPVQIVETFTCYNLNPQKMELLLHRFFSKVCLDVEIRDKGGKRYEPREWFTAPLAVIEEAIRLLMSGEIVNSYYDEKSKIILEK